MASFPVRTAIDGDLIAIVELPYTTMMVAVQSAQSQLFLSPSEQDRLRVLLETPGRTCDEVLDSTEFEHEQVRCVLRPSQLTLVQGVVSVTIRGSSARSTLLQILRVNTGTELDGIGR